MKTQWLFEDHIFTENVDKMKLAVKKQGMIFKTYEYKPFTDKSDLKKLFSNNDNVVFYGSLQLSNFIYNKTNWHPGTFCTLPNYECFNYYPILGEYHINSNYFLLTVADLIRQKELIFDSLGNSGVVFIRPTSGFKSFTGTIVDYNNWDKDINFFTAQCNQNTLVLLSSPKNIINEWRLVICDGKIITSSQYKNKKGLYVEHGCPPDVIDFANEVLLNTKIEPDKVFCLDIGETLQNELKVIEINSFSSAGLYDCNFDLIVEVVSEMAELIHNDTI